MSATADRRIPAIEEQVGTSIVTVPLTDADREVLEAMAAAAGLSIVNVIRVACWRFAHHLDLDPALPVFGVRRSRGVVAEAGGEGVKHG